jgi:hypothetical protein
MIIGERWPRTRESGREMPKIGIKFSTAGYRDRTELPQADPRRVISRVRTMIEFRRCVRENYKLEALSLREITRSVSRVSSNPLLDKLSGLVSVTPMATQIAGIRYGQRLETAKNEEI